MSDKATVQHATCACAAISPRPDAPPNPVVPYLGLLVDGLQQRLAHDGLVRLLDDRVALLPLLKLSAAVAEVTERVSILCARI